MSLENWVLLCQTQDQLTDLRIGPVDCSYTSVISQIPQIVGDLTRLRSISIRATSLDILQASQRVLETHPNIDALELSCCWDLDEFNELDDRDTGPGLLFRELFSHLMPIPKSPPLTLTKLILEQIELGFADRYLMDVVTLKSLQFLHLGNCETEDVLFSYLSRPDQLSAGLETLLWLRTDIVEPQTLESLEHLLEVLPALRKLHIELRTTSALPKIQALCHTRSSLRSLFIRCHDINEVQLRYSIKDFLEICTKCSHLRELSLGVLNPGLKGIEVLVVNVSTRLLSRHFTDRSDSGLSRNFQA